MRLHQTNEWGLTISSIDGVRPGTSTGTSVTPTNNTTGGTFATLIASGTLTEDAYAIELCVNNVGISGAARDCIVTLGLDPAGGTSFTDTVNLLCGQASTMNNLGIGHKFWFPLWIKAGTTIGARASVNSATVTAIQAYAKVFCKPRRPELIWCGQKIEELGLTIGSSTGTSVTAGTASEGSWTSIGTTTRSHRFYEFGFGMNDAATTNNAYAVDVSVGDASNKKIIIADHVIGTRDVEMASKPSCPTWARSTAGDVVYARTQAGPNAASTHSIAVYAMGD